MSALCSFTVQQLVDEERLTLNDIITLEKWMREKRGELPELTREQLAIFFLAQSNDIEKTEYAIMTNYKIRREHPEIFGNRNMQCDEVQKATTVVEITDISEKTPEGYDIYVGRLSDPIYSNIDMEPCLKLVGMATDSVISQYPPKGVIVLLDMKGIGIMHLTRVKFSLLKPIFQYIQGALNVKLIRVHILNTVYFLDKIMAIISPFLSAELNELLHFHPPGMDFEEFYKTYVPKKCLPEDYGGDLPSIQSLHESNMKKLADFQHYFDEEERQRNQDLNKAV